MTVCCPSLLRVSGRFIGTKGIAGSDSDGGSGDNDCTFLFQILLGNRILVTTDDLDQLRKL